MNNTITTKNPSFFKGLTGQILIAMVLGAILGIIIHNYISPADAEAFSKKIKILATVFIRLVQMIISPFIEKKLGMLVISMVLYMIAVLLL